MAERAAASSGLANCNSATPPTASATAASARGVSRSPSTMRDSTATTAGSVARITPAAVAVVSDTPVSMQIENRKLPKNDIVKSCRRSRGESGASPAAPRVHGIIATAAMPKRRKASANTGIAATSGLDSAT